MKAFSIRDTKAEASNFPFASATRATAMREIQLGLANNAMLSANGYDFDLYEVGGWDSATGEWIVQEKHHVCNIGDLVPKEELSDGTTDTGVRLTA